MSLQQFFATRHLILHLCIIVLIDVADGCTHEGMIDDIDLQSRQIAKSTSMAISVGASEKRRLRGAVDDASKISIRPRI